MPCVVLWTSVKAHSGLLRAFPRASWPSVNSLLAGRFACVRVVTARVRVRINCKGSTPPDHTSKNCNSMKNRTKLAQNQESSSLCQQKHYHSETGTPARKILKSSLDGELPSLHIWNTLAPWRRLCSRVRDRCASHHHAMFRRLPVILDPASP